MRQNPPREALDRSATVPGAIVFERMAASLEGGGRLHRRWALLLAIAGGGLLAWGLGSDQFAPLAAGGMAVAVAILPWHTAGELFERAEGMRVLGEDWAEPGAKEVLARRRAGLIDLVERLYAPDRSG